MIISAHQPAYLPWLGYFDKLRKSDIFVYLDSVQFEKNSFVNRNKVKTPQGACWLTVPVKVKGHLSSTLMETQIDNGQNWREKHLKTIYLNYKKAPQFDAYFPKLEAVYTEKYDLLSELCFEHLKFWLLEFGLGAKKILRSSDLDIQSKKSDLVLDLCKSLRATKYISGALGVDYLKTEEFKIQGIEVEFQNYQHPVYKQLYGEFLPYMGVLDFWMNRGNILP